MRRTLATTSAILALIAPSISLAAVPAPIASAAGSSITTAVFFDQLQQYTQNTISDARNAGDFLTIRAAGQALLVLEQFRTVYRTDFDRSLKKLDKIAFEQLKAVQSTVDGLRADARTATTAMARLEGVSLELASKIDPHSKRTFITSYSPKVFRSGLNAPYIVRINGSALDDAAPVLVAGQKRIAARQVTRNQIEFELPPDVLLNATTRERQTPLRLEYSSVGAGWWKRTMGIRDQERANLVLAVLPETLGVYGYASKVETMLAERQNKGPVALPQFAGVNDDIPYAIQASAGWNIDPRSFTHEQGDGGGHSYCIGVRDTEANVKAPAFWAHVGRIGSQGLTPPRRGYVNCRVWYAEYREVPAVVAGPSGTDTLIGWDEVVVQKPDRLVEMTVSVRTFADTSNRTYTASDNAHPLYEVRFEPSRIVILPRIPADYLR